METRKANSLINLIDPYELGRAVARKYAQIIEGATREKGCVLDLTEVPKSEKLEDLYNDYIKGKNNTS